MDVFHDLEHDRNWMVGATSVPLPLKWHDINDYCVAHGFTGELQEDTLYFVREMDFAYLKLMAKKL